MSEVRAGLRIVASERRVCSFGAETAPEADGFYRLLVRTNRGDSTTHGAARQHFYRTF